jgi:hypothetical protein
LITLLARLTKRAALLADVSVRMAILGVDVTMVVLQTNFSRYALPAYEFAHLVRRAFTIVFASMGPRFFSKNSLFLSFTNFTLTVLE